MQRLAIATEDHALAFGDFQGEIPTGQPGAGLIEQWDAGTYTWQEWTEGRISFSLSGSRYVGEYSMVRFQRGGAGAWLIRKSRRG